MLPPERIDGLLLMHHKHTAHAPGELLEIRKTAAGPNLVLQHAPQAFTGIEVVAAAGGQALQPKAPMPRSQRRGERVRPVDTTTIDDPHDLFPSRTKRGQHLMDILSAALGITLRDDLIEDFGWAVLDCPNDTEHDPARDPVPGARAAPGVTFAGLLMLDLTPSEGACGQAVALGMATPPASAGEGKAPHDGCVGREQDALAATGLGLERRECDRGVREGRWIRRQPTGRTREAPRIFFRTPRTLSRPSWTPVCWARTRASSRHLH